MSKFQVGDKVMVTGDAPEDKAHLIGEEGIINNVLGGKLYRVKFPQLFRTHTFFEYQLDLVEITLSEEEIRALIDWSLDDGDRESFEYYTGKLKELLNAQKKNINIY